MCGEAFDHIIFSRRRDSLTAAGSLIKHSSTGVNLSL
jgi:hypothetical protein